MKKLITTDGTKYAQNLKAFAIIDDKQTDGKPIMIDANVLEEAFENASEADKAAFENVIHFDVEGEEITVTPTTSQQVKTPGKGYNAITKATINAVTSAVDENIIATNIKKGVTILGVTGSCNGETELHNWDGTGTYKKVHINTTLDTTTPEMQEKLQAYIGDWNDYKNIVVMNSGDTDIKWYCETETNSKDHFLTLSKSSTKFTPSSSTSEDIKILKIVLTNGADHITVSIDGESSIYSEEGISFDYEKIETFASGWVGLMVLLDFLQVRESDKIEE